MSIVPDMLYQLGGVPVSMGCPIPKKDGRVYIVDGTTGVGADGNEGTADAPLATIGEANDRLREGDTVFIQPIKMVQTDTDPTSYDETIIVDVANVSFIGVGRGRTQGGLPQMKIGAGTTAMIQVRAPGCYFSSIGINGAASTGGGIKLVDDGGTTYSAFGTTIENCHFKNCACHATNGSLGGAIYWGSGGGAWQSRFRGNMFYKNLADIVLVGTGSSVPQDIVIEDNVFSGPIASVDINLFLKGGGSGINGVTVRNNVFPCFPNISSGTNAKQIDMLGCVGILSGNYFGSSGKSYGASGKSNNIPTTVLMAGNYDETSLVART